MSAQVKDNSQKREGKCSVRTSKGIPILDETYSYTVVCTSKNEDYANVVTATGLPFVGDFSPSGFGVYRAANATRREQNPCYWDVVVDFSSEVEESSQNPDPKSDPVTWVPVYETKYVKIPEVVTKDKNDDAIANSCGQSFPTGLTIMRKIPCWEFFQIEAPVSDEVIVDRSETINSVEFKGRAAKSLLLTVLNSTVGFYYGARRRLTHYELQYNKKLWTHKRLDTGTYYFDGTTDSDGPVKKPYYDSASHVINGPLDGSGEKVASGEPPFTLSFDYYDELAFATFLRI